MKRRTEKKRKTRVLEEQAKKTRWYRGQHDWSMLTYYTNEIEAQMRATGTAFIPYRWLKKKPIRIRQTS